MAQRAEQEQGIRLLLAAIHLGELSSFSRLFFSCVGQDGENNSSHCEDGL